MLHQHVSRRSVSWGLSDISRHRARTLTPCITVLIVCRLCSAARCTHQVLRLYAGQQACHAQEIAEELDVAEVDVSDELLEVAGPARPGVSLCGVVLGLGCGAARRRLREIVGEGIGQTFLSARQSARDSELGEFRPLQKRQSLHFADVLSLLRVCVSPSFDGCAKFDNIGKLEICLQQNRKNFEAP